MTVFIKLGGSLITDKRKPKSFRADTAREIARQLAAIRRLKPELPLIVGHGSGSFGHAEAAKHDTARGLRGDAQRLGFAKVGAVATELSLLILSVLLEAGLPAMRFQPSSMLHTNDRRVQAIDARLLMLALEQGLLPLLHGDIALDKNIGGTIVSTEDLFCALAAPLAVSQVILLGEVAGVLDHRGRVIPAISPQSLPAVLPELGGADGADVTGGMRQKVTTMLALVSRQPAITVTIADGTRDDALVDILLRDIPVGTRIHAGA